MIQRVSKCIITALSFVTAGMFYILPVSGEAQQPNYTGPVNYVRTWDALKPESNANNITMAAAVKDHRMTTQYMDGLGRPVQTVVKQGSLKTGVGAVDLISTNVYDEFGRERYAYLPFAANAAASNISVADGLFKATASQQQTAFYGNTYGSSPIPDQGETYYYGQMDFEASPLNRVTETFAPGNSWVGTAGQTLEANRRSIKTKYLTNTISDSVRIWNVANAGSIGAWGAYTSTAIYLPGQLWKTIVIDEHGKQVIEYKDKGGLTILKKVQIGGSGDSGSGIGHTTDWLCTYYIYDDLNNLRCIIQPLGVRLISSNWSLTENLLNEQCFRYEYDERNRMILKKVPAAGETRIVYDARDRVVMTQDAGLRTVTPNRWIINKYDSLNRVIETGLLGSSTSFTALLDSAKTSTNFPSTTANYEQWTINHYDDYSSPPAGMNNTFDNTWSSQFISTDPGSPPYAEPLVASSGTIGFVTWRKVKGMYASWDLYTINIYDEKGRVIQVKTRNTTGGNDVLTTQYDWSGKPLITVKKQQKSGNNATTIVEVTKMTYDDIGRLVRVEKKIGHSGINGGTLPASFTTVLEQSYDALGQLIKKKLAPDLNNGEGLETLNYDYNIRGWLLGANRPYLKDTTSTANYFGFDLAYDKAVFPINSVNTSYGSPQYNGNIGGSAWKSTGDDHLRKFDFTYDAANRILSADFNQFTQMQFNKSAGVDFSVSGISYDANGNILTMNQRGMKNGHSETIDSLLYTYYSQSNKLRSVWDRRNDTASRLGDFRSSKLYMDQLGGNKTTSTTDYTYNANGSLTADYNKSIVRYTGSDGIQYNWLGLPSKIHIKKDNTSDKGNIEINYTVDGVKIQKKVHEPGVDTTITIYLNNLVFVNDTLSFIGMEEGRIRKVGDSLVYDYFIKDHLGNVRMVLTTEQRTDAYPVASMETAQTTTEEALYSNLATTRVDKPSGYPNDTYTNPNDKVAKVRGDGNKIGPAILLKVMAGDTFNIRANAWWTGTTTTTQSSPLTSIVAALISGAPGVSGGKIGATELTTTLLDPEVTLFLSGQPFTAGKPKAYLNWILFDEQFRYVQSNSGAEQVDGAGEFKTYNKSSLPVEKNGYLYIYTSNETNYDVFFDNLQVTHVRGALLEETHYYPFGLSMAGISSKALAFGNPENKKKYNGIEFNSDFDINMYDAFYRNLDPQIGRFWQIDPKPNTSVSLYASIDNNPILMADILGDTAIVFGKDGSFLRFQDDGKKTFSGRMVTGSKSKVTTDANGNTVISTKIKYSKFSLNDGALVAQAVKNGVINKVEMVSDSKIEQQIDRSGVKASAARDNPLSYAMNSVAGGSMDYAVQGAMAGDLNKNTLYVTGGVGYDIADFGNFLWGRGMAELGITIPTAQAGAQYNHIFNSRRGNDVTPLFDLGPGTYGKPGLLDAESDQNAIRRGHASSPSTIKAQQEIHQRIHNYMQHWRPYQN